MSKNVACSQIAQRCPSVEDSVVDMAEVVDAISRVDAPKVPKVAACSAGLMAAANAVTSTRVCGHGGRNTIALLTCTSRQTTFVPLRSVKVFEYRGHVGVASFQLLIRCIDSLLRNCCPV
ncbi:hypothetical protein GN244_ATG04241 [Phytophthora infestans]|uniref:Uncharacterized protein n=1 Tax=Phytophthora infestans TaxID=4787 RepID=A0A833WNA3_PHYIN|nr:hypothetical protein GN244_ATG04241 [Phytophthora infestans]